MKVHYFQHVSFEGVACMQSFFDEHAQSVERTMVYNGQNFPDLNSYDILIIMGGPMGTYDEDKYPWLVVEKEYIAKAIKANKFVLGICLGAQLIADVLGADIYKNTYREIGWHPITFNKALENSAYYGIFPAKADIYHWHGDTFDMPENALHIGSSEACKNQGFIYNDRVIGLQFHLETNPEWVESLAERFPEELDGSRYVQSVEEMLAKPAHFSENHIILNKLLTRLKELAA